MRTKHVKSVLAIIMFFTLAFVPLPSSADQKEAEKGRVAVVNGVVITQDILDREMTRYQQSMKSTEKALDDSQLSLIKKHISNPQHPHLQQRRIIFKGSVQL